MSIGHVPNNIQFEPFSPLLLLFGMEYGVYVSDTFPKWPFATSDILVSPTFVVIEVES